MSRIDDLIADLCPNGVEFRPLGDVATFKRGTQLKATERVPGPFPVVTAGRSESLHHNSWNYDKGSVTVTSHGAHAGHVNFWASPIWLANNVFLLAPNADLFDRRYFYYFLKTNEAYLRAASQGGGVPYINVRDLRGLRVPLPPFEVQREIVKVLDTFTALEDELEALLDAEAKGRPTQQSYIRSRVLRLDEPSSVSGSVPLSEVVGFINGKPQERLVTADGTVALLTARFISTAGKSARWVNPESALTPARRGDIAMVMSDLPNGRALARCYYVEADGKCSANQRVCLLRVRDETTTLARYLYHFLDRNPQLLAFDNGQDQTHLKKGQILGIQVPTIPCSDQEQAASVLDRLGAGTRELVAALGAEQEARRRQYEYCRDRLLTFREET